MSSYTAQSREPGRAPLPMTDRQDRWWVQPVLIVATLVLFGIYAGFRAFENNFYETRQLIESQPGLQAAPLYLSPFYSPPLHHLIASWPAALSPALFLVIFPLSFRGTCYYCRKAYYRAFFWDPPACAVAEIRDRARMKYSGETTLPFVVNNFHRYALYLILVYVVFHWYHLYEAFHYVDSTGSVKLGYFGLGTLIFGLDAVLLSLYVFSCHSWRHLIGGGANNFSRSPIRLKLWQIVTTLNKRHGLYFWLSLATVGLADIYVRLVASGIISDLAVRL